MAEMVGSALVQEAVSEAISVVLSKREEKAPQCHLLERLEMAHSELEFALDISSKMPITEVSLLRRRMMLKRAFEECDHVLYNHKMQVRETEDAEQGVPVSFPSRKKIMRAVRLAVSSLICPNKDLLSTAYVARFEFFADKAGKFVRDMEYGCPVVHQRFCSPLIRQLLEGKALQCKMVQGRQSRDLSIEATRMEEHGVVACLAFEYKDFTKPRKSFKVGLLLRLSECTDIVGIISKCLQSFGPPFKSLAEVAVAELTQVFTQIHVSDPHPDDLILGVKLALSTLGIEPFRPDPLCCTTNDGLKRCRNNIVSSELTGRFPEQVCLICCTCYNSVLEYNLQSSPDEAHQENMKAWPPLELTASFMPHSWSKIQQSSSLHQMEQILQMEAIDCFSRQPEQTKYQIHWLSSHGSAHFYVNKLVTERETRPGTIQLLES